MTEVLLAFICLSGPGCTEASQAYYEQNGQLRGAVYHALVLVENKAPPAILAVVPFVHAIHGQRVVLSVGHGCYIKMDPAPQLLFKRDF